MVGTREETAIDEHEPDLELDSGDEPDADNEGCTYRATFANGCLTLNDWTPALANAGPIANHFRGRAEEGVAIADVTVIRNAHGEPEGIVDFMTHGDQGAAEDALIAWAQLVGHRRIWLEGRVVDTDGLPASGAVGATCPTCGAHWEEHNLEFQTYVRSQGVFPSWCPLCGGTLPQWRSEVPAGSQT